MSANPYTDLPSAAFWGEAVSFAAPGALDPCVRGEIIPPGAKIATMGSCFAQHLSAHVAQSGLTYFVPEAAPAGLSAADARALGYGVFSARYGNVYSAPQALQLLRRALGQFRPVEDVWERDGRFVDAFRPRIAPDGFESPAAVRAEAARHLTCVERVFKEADWLIFTLGLTEHWRSRIDGAVYPLAPGVAGGRFDPARHEFVNATVSETVADLAALIGETGKINPGLKILLTVSPVALMATYEPRHVLTSTVCSKSILRAAADEIERRFPNVIYFPSYEIVTSPAAEGRYYADDLRQVNRLGVDHVMRVFARHFIEASAGRAGPGPAPGPAYVLPRSEEVVCDEEDLQRAFAKPKLWSK